MVEIIEHGNKNIINCDFCGAKLKYATDDVMDKTHYITQSDSDFIKYIICPDCNNHVDIGKMYMRTV